MKRLLFALFFALAVSSNLPAQDVMVSPEGERGYLIGPGDVIEAKVLGEGDFDFVAAVDQDGKFEVPFFEEPVWAKCRTEKELRADVTKLLSKYLKNPMLSLRVTERNSRPPVVVSGEVREQQKIDLRRKASLLEIITASGGITEDASGLIRVYRPKPPLCDESDADVAWTKSDQDYEVPSRLFTLSSIRTGDEASNPTIYPGDLVIVEKASPVYITGEVNSPQGLRIPEGGLSLMRAIAMVSGVRREAKTKEIKIYRLKDNSQDRDIIAVNYDQIKIGEQKDVMLQPYDIVEVDKSKKSVGQLIFEAVTGLGRNAVTSLGTGLPTRILY